MEFRVDTAGDNQNVQVVLVLSFLFCLIARDRNLDLIVLVSELSIILLWNSEQIELIEVHVNSMS